MNIINKGDMIEFLENKIKIDDINEEKSVLKIVDELYDLSKDNIIPLDDLETFVFRKRYGILDYGVPQTKEYIANEYDIGYTKIRKLLDLAITKLSFRIKKIDKHTKVDKLSSLDINPKFDEYKNILIDHLLINNNIKNKLMMKYIFTLNDLLGYSLTELKNFLEKKEFSNLVTYIHSLNLKFIEELEIEDRKNLIQNSPFSIIENSSIYWIKSVEKISYLKLKENNINDIKSLIINLNLLSKTEQLIVMKELKDIKLGMSLGKKVL